MELPDRSPVVTVGGVTSALDAVLDAAPMFAGRACQVADLTGGLTNRNYRVSTETGDFVVRLSPSGTDLLAINRAHEYANSVIAAAAGVGAPVFDFLPDLGVLVVGYIDGVTFTDAHLSLPGNLERVAQSCRRLHGGGRFVNEFDMFQISRAYLSLVQERGFRLPADYLDFLPQVADLQRAMAVGDEGTVPCNNDLLAGNFVDDQQQIWLIDYEYSGNNDPCFELGNIWSECHLSLEQLEALVRSYYGRSRRSRFARAQLQGLMSKYGWTLWASIQHATSALDFDFWSWGMEKYDGAVEMFRSPALPRLLEDVQRKD